MNIRSITPRELHQLLVQDRPIDLIDVRWSWEYRRGHVPGAQLVPLGHLTADAVQAIRKNREGEPVYVICHSGGRSLTACKKLIAAGMHAVNVAGGTSAWRRAGLPMEHPAAGSLWQRFRPVILPLVMITLLLGLWVHPYFLIAAGLLWVGVLIAGGGTCPFSSCSLPSVQRAGAGQSSGTPE